MENSILNIEVSRYSHYSGKAVNCNLLEYLYDDSYLERVLEIRSKTTKEERDFLKIKLPGITPSAICFPTRSADNIVNHTGLINFDIDKIPLEKMNEFFNIIKKMPFVAYCGLSVSGTGYWGVIPISNTKKHNQHFEAIQHYFRLAGIDRPYFDIGVKDITRFRFYSIDLNAHFNHSAQVFSYIFETPSRAVKVHCPLNKTMSDENPFNDFNINGDIETILLIMVGLISRNFLKVHASVIADLEKTSEFQPIIVSN
jgi:hypothetical protein